jgi:hypothetical protein
MSRFLCCIIHKIKFVFLVTFVWINFSMIDNIDHNVYYVSSKKIIVYTVLLMKWNEKRGDANVQRKNWYDRFSWLILFLRIGVRHYYISTIRWTFSPLLVWTLIKIGHKLYVTWINLAIHISSPSSSSVFIFLNYTDTMSLSLNTWMKEGCSKIK